MALHIRIQSRKIEHKRFLYKNSYAKNHSCFPRVENRNPCQSQIRIRAKYFLYEVHVEFWRLATKPLGAGAGRATGPKELIEPRAHVVKAAIRQDIIKRYTLNSSVTLRSCETTSQNLKKHRHYPLRETNASSRLKAPYRRRYAIPWRR